MVVSIRAPVEPLYPPQWKGDADALKIWFGDKLNGLDLTTDQQAALKAEGIDDPSDLFLLDDEAVEALHKNLATRSFDTDGKALPTHKLSVRTILRLKGTIKIVKYLSMIRRDITWEAVDWQHVQGFLEEWKSLEAASAKEHSEPPKFRNTTILDHLHAIQEWCQGCHGEYKCPIDYLINESYRDESSPADAPALVSKRLFGEGRTSIRDELMARVSRHTAMAVRDNEVLFNAIASGFVGTAFAPNTDRFAKTRDGAAFFKHIVSTYGHSKVHEEEAAKARNWMMSNIWAGPANGTLVSWLEKHGRLRIVYGRAGNYAVLQKIDDRTHVEWILKNLTYNDPDIGIAKALIKASDGTENDLRNSVEKTCLHLSQVDYVGKQSGGKKKARLADVGAVGGGDDGSNSNKRSKREGDARYQAMLSLKGGRGKTGVDLRFHTHKEFKKLPRAQRQELSTWRATELKKMGFDEPAPRNGRGKKTKANLSEAVVDQKSFFAELSQMNANLVKDIKGAFTSKPNEDKATAAAVTAGIAAYKRATAEVSALEVVLPPVGEEDAAATVATAEVGETTIEVSDDGENSDRKCAALEAEIDERVAASARVGLAGILKKTGKAKRD